MELTETSPTKLSQQEEALLLDDGELHNVPKKNIADDIPAAKTETLEQTNDDNVSTTTTDKEQVDNSTSALNTKQSTNLKEKPLKVNRNILKRNSVVVAAETTAVLTATENEIEPKKLRVEAPEFHPKESTSEELVESINVVTVTGEIISENVMTEDESLEKSEPQLVENQSVFSNDTVESITEESDATVNNSQQSEIASDLLSQESATTSTKYTSEEIDSDYSLQGAIPEFETEDSDEGNERLNPKTRVEREIESGKLCLIFV